MAKSHKREAVEQLEDVFGPADTKLDSELVPYLSDRAGIGTILQHPLVYSVPHFDRLNFFCNQMLAKKKEKLAKARKTKSWTTFVYLHERPWRINAFMEIETRLTDKQYWTILARLWTDSENIHQNQQFWLDALSSKRPGSFMSADDRRAFAKLPETLTVYRGYVKNQNFDGVSYTLNQERAQWFAARFSTKAGAVRKRTVKKSDVFAYTNDRNEEEIIILPRGEGD